MQSGCLPETTSPFNISPLIIDLALLLTSCLPLTAQSMMGHPTLIIPKTPDRETTTLDRSSAGTKIVALVPEAVLEPTRTAVRYFAALPVLKHGSALFGRTSIDLAALHTTIPKSFPLLLRQRFKLLR